MCFNEQNFNTNYAVESIIIAYILQHMQHFYVNYFIHYSAG